MSVIFLSSISFLFFFIIEQDSYTIYILSKDKNIAQVKLVIQLVYRNFRKETTLLDVSIK